MQNCTTFKIKTLISWKTQLLYTTHTRVSDIIILKPRGKRDGPMGHKKSPSNIVCFVTRMYDLQFKCFH